MRKLVIVAMLLTSNVIVAQAQPMPTQYMTEVDARRACPTDTVVWANLSTKVIHQKGDKFYGTTKNGAYVCQTPAMKSGMHLDKSN